MRVRMIAVLLVLVFIFSITGCTKDKTVSDTGEASGSIEEMGRYMEQEVELPELEGNEKILTILRNQQQFEVYVQNQGNRELARFILQQDHTWKQDSPGWLSTLENYNLKIVDVCLGEDGYYYACFNSYTDAMVSAIIKASKDGSTSELLKIPYFDEVVANVQGNDYYPMIKNFRVLENGEFVLFDSRNDHALIILSADGYKVNTIDTEEVQSYLVSGNHILGMSKEGRIFSYDAGTHKIERTMDYHGKSSSKAYAVKEDGTILMADSAGIHRIVPGGTLWETTVDGVLNTMNMPTVTLNSLYASEAASREEYDIVYIDTNGDYQLKHYQFDQRAPSIPENEITVYSLNENKSIRQAISLYQSKNADVKINYIVAMEEEGGTVTDYTRALNTELLSGNGADILVLDGLPATSYIDKGILADLSDIIGKPYQDSTYLTNIIAPYDNDGKIYYIPVRFSVPLRLGNPEALKATNQLSDLNTLLNKTTRPYAPPTSYAALIRDNLAQYIDDICVNGSLEQDKLKEFLEVMKLLAMNSNSVADFNDYASYVDASGNPYAVRNKDLFGNNSGLLLGCDTVTLQISNVDDFVIPNALMNKRKLDFDTLGHRFIPNGLIGLNRGSKETERSKAFISFLLTPEVQDTNLNDGFPINASSLSKWFDEEHPNVVYTQLNAEGNRITGSWPTKKRRNLFLRAIKDLNKPIESNVALYDMIIQSGVSYLSGESDIDQVTSEIMSRVNAYLTE